MKRMLGCLALLAAVGCSQAPLPTAPTPTQSQPPTASGPAAINLQWTALASSCGVVTTPPMQPPMSDATVVQQSDGSVIASWPYQSPTRNARLYARFVNQNNAWGLCSWDIADV